MDVRTQSALAPAGASPRSGPLETVGHDLAIPALGLAPWGTHFCQFFNTEQDLLDILIPYVRRGLENNEACICIASAPLDVDDVAEALGRALDDFERRVAEGQLTITSGSQWYSRARADQQRMSSRGGLPFPKALARSQLADVLSHGSRYAGVRCIGNMSWVDDPGWDEFMLYEDSVTEVVSGQHILGLCNYSLNRCDASQLLDVMSLHQFALIKRGDWTLIEPSERKRATAAVEQMNHALAERTEQLEAALADLRGFSQWVTHDLRVPLRHITSFGELLAESWEGRLDNDGRELLHHIRRSAAQMDRLIVDILAYSTAQRSSLQAAPLDLERLVREVWQELTETIGTRRLELRLGPLPQTHGDRAMITQVLANLLGNAVKFTSKKPVGYIEVGGDVTDRGECVYYVRDNGAGFDMAHANKVFGAFERLHSRAEFEGTGLGLAIVKDVITRHGGRVWADSTPGAGATFYFTLPTTDS
jgi:signal transduction histidine kinase